MKSKYYKPLALGILACALQTGSAFSQSINPCATSEMTETIYLQHPELKQLYNDYNSELTQKINQKTERSGSLYIIPVVFHVIHINGTENIPDSDIIAQVARLNTDYRKLNTDISSAPPVFQAIAADVNIEFRLAQKDPDGNCTNGIERIYSHKTINAGDQSKLNQWPRDKYLNVWVVSNIPPGSSPGTILAYATFPSSVATFAYPLDGVIMISSECNGFSRTLTHEVGHWLSLEHTWGNTEVATVCGDDNVTDTPQTKGHFSTCPAYDSTCVPGVLENINNYMDYSSCKYMFTVGQADRMRTALESSVSARNNLWSMSNLIATGTDGSTYAVCKPEPDFYANRYSICPGGTVSFTENILYGTPSANPTWSFDIGTGTPVTSSLTNPTITYNIPGDYNVTLTASNASGTGIVSKNALIHVSENYAMVTPGLTTEDFDNSSLYYSRWHSVDMDENSRTWWLTNTASYSGSQSMVMNGYYNYAGDVDQLFSPSYDLSFVSSATLTFRCAAATKGTSIADLDDQLKVSVSNNCGASWVPISGLTKTGAALSNNGYHPEEFIPNAPSQWALLSGTITGIYATANTRLKFEYTTGHESNNIYIDDVNISGVLGIANNNIDESSISIFPNPSNQTSTLSYHLNKKADTKIELVDVLGKKIMEVNNQGQLEGDYSIQISKQDLHLHSGIYFVKMSINNAVITKKLIISE